jgi:transcriptional regulator of acetoin/glycerol metabolism
MGSGRVNPSPGCRAKPPAHRSARETLKESQGRIAGPRGAAAKLGIPRQTLEWKIRNLNIDKLAFRSR